MSLSKIKEPINIHIEKFNSIFSSINKSDIRLLNIIINYIIKQKGKQIRPIFTFLSAAFNGEINDKTYRGAALIELLHTATLLHDDVVDNSYMRRGVFSINSLWKNKIAVLVGDYFLSRGLSLSLENDDFDLLKIVSNASKEMSEGELLQMEKARKLDITENIYFEIIQKKTASLIASCCAVGAASVTNDKNIINNMHLFGEAAGIAFQIKDDLLDYGSNHIGKATKKDIKEKKITLPLIWAINNSENKRLLLKLVKNHKNNPHKINEIIKIVLKSGGYEYAETKMIEQKNKALSIISSFGNKEYRNYLEQLLTFTIERKS